SSRSDRWPSARKSLAFNWLFQGLREPAVQGFWKEEGICNRTSPLLAMILPSSPQLPPFMEEAVLKVSASPPWTEIFFSFSAEKNATHCPSGEKKGEWAPSVPVISADFA